MKRIAALLALCTTLIPASGFAQDGQARGSTEPIFSWPDRPSVTAREESLTNPRSREAKPNRAPHNPYVKETPDGDLEFGIEGYVWAGVVMKL